MPASASCPQENASMSLTGAEGLVEVLERAGVEQIFGLCGHTNVAVLAALESSPIRFVAVHHEQMASHAADGYARISGRPGVVLTHLGPGLTNALTGVANAALDGVPMLVITGNVQSYFFGRHAHMESTRHGDADQATAYGPFCKRIWRIQRADALLPAVSAALQATVTPPAGPVLLDVAMDVFSSYLNPTSVWRPPVEIRPPALSDGVAQEIAELLLSARYPVVYAGADVARSGAGQQLAAVAEALAAPIAYALMGKGAVPDDHPLVVGMSGLWGTPAANAACRDSDVLLAVGAEFGELDSSSWEPGVTFAIPPTRLVHIHVDPCEIGRSYSPEVGAIAEARQALEAIARQLPSPPTRVRLSPELDKLRRQFQEEVRASQLAPGYPIHPARVLADVAAVLGPEDILVGDTGWNKNGVGQQIPFDRPARFVAPGGFATMGFGPAAALGTKLAKPDAATVALVGDGAFLANLSVVVTAVEERIPVVWAVMNNGTYATISGMQKRHFGSDYGSTFDASALDYVGMARSLGAGGIRIKSADELRPAMKKAIAAQGPYVVDIPCSLDHVPTTGHWDINTLFTRAITDS